MICYYPYTEKYIISRIAITDLLAAFLDDDSLMLEGAFSGKGQLS